MLFSDSHSPVAHQRVRALAEERDGFRLAEIDLTLRGEGDLLGTKQSGLPEFKVARLPEDQELLERARSWALETLRHDPMLDQPEHAILQEAIARKFGMFEAERIAA